MARRELVFKRYQQADSTGNFSLSGLGHDVQWSDPAATSDLTGYPEAKSSSPPMFPLDLSLPEGVLRNRRKAVTEECLQNITGRMNRLLSSFEADSYSEANSMEDYASRVWQNPSPVDANDHEAMDNVNSLIEGYKGMCGEREEILSSLQEWFGVSHLDDMKPGLGNADLGEMFESGELLSERLKAEKQPMTKLANLGKTVESLVAKNKELEKELLEAKESAKQSEAMRKNELKIATEGNKQDNDIWKNAASEVCKLLSEVRESGRQEANRLIVKMEGMVETLEKRSCMIESLRQDVEEQREKIEEYKEKLRYGDPAENEVVSLNEFWQDQLSAIKEELSQSKQQYLIAQARVQELEEKPESNRNDREQLQHHGHLQDDQYQMQPASSDPMSGPQDVHDIHEEDETKDIDEGNEITSQNELQSQLQILEKENVELKKKLAKWESEDRTLQRHSEMAVIQESKALSTEIGTSNKMEVRGNEREFKGPNLDEQLEHSHKLMMKAQPEEGLSAKVIDALPSSVVEERKELKTVVDQAIQTDLSGLSTRISGTALTTRSITEVDNPHKSMISYPNPQTQNSDSNQAQLYAPISPLQTQEQVDTRLQPSSSSVIPDSWLPGSSCEISADPQEPPLLLQSPDGELMFDNEVDTVECHSYGVQHGNTLKKRSGSAGQSGEAAVSDDGRQNWMCEEICSDNVREYVHGMVSRINEIITEFVQKTSALVDAEGLNDAGTTYDLRSEKPKNEQCQVYRTSQIDSKAGRNVPLSLNQLTDESHACPLVVDAESREWCKTVPASCALPLIGSHCVNVLQLIDELFAHQTTKQENERQSVVKVFINRQQENPWTETEPPPFPNQSLPRSHRIHRRSIVRRRMSTRGPQPNASDHDVSGVSLSSEGSRTNVTFSGSNSHMDTNNQYPSGPPEGTDGARYGARRPFLSRRSSHFARRPSLRDAIPTLPEPVAMPVIIEHEREEHGKLSSDKRRMDAVASKTISFPRRLTQAQVTPFSRRYSRIDQPQSFEDVDELRALFGPTVSSLSKTLNRIEQQKDKDKRDKMRQDNSNMQSTVSHMKSPLALPRTLIGAQLHFFEVDVPKATTPRRGPIQLRGMSPQPQRAAQYARTRTLEPRRGHTQATSPSSRRREGRRSPRPEDQNSLDAAMRDGMTTTELMKTVDQYKPAAAAGIHSTRDKVQPSFTYFAETNAASPVPAESTT